MQQIAKFDLNALALATLIVTTFSWMGLNDVQAAPPAKSASIKKVVKKPLPPNYMPMRWKYSWKYKTKTADGIETAFSVEDIHDIRKDDGAIWHQYQTETSPTQKFTDIYSHANGFVVDNHVEYSNGAMKADFIPPKPILKMAPEVGDNWVWTGKGMMGTELTEKFQVLAFEEVTVPAGKFKTVKVQSDAISNNQKALKIYWYGANVGLVKSYTESGPIKSTTELVSYVFPKLEPGELEEELNRNK